MYKNEGSQVSFKHIFSIIIFGVAALGCAQTPTDAEGNAIAAANDEGVICVKQADMGSRLGKRVCSTRAEREEAARITREEIRNSEHASQTRRGVTPASPAN